MKISTSVIACIAATAFAASSASASVRVWDWERGDPGTSGLNDSGGTFKSIFASFDSVSNHLTWTMTFSDQVTKGFSLALNNGPNPKGHAGELALLYGDFRDGNDIVLTAYAYNGQNNLTSWKDGNGVVSGDQTPDAMKGLNDRSTWVLDASKIDHMDGSRTLSFTIDATDLINHTPMYPDNVDPWYGIGFGEKLGLWLHPFRTFNPTYNDSGLITSLSTGSQGWFDGANFDTIPTPGSVALMGLSGLLTLGRKKRA